MKDLKTEIRARIDDALCISSIYKAGIDRATDSMIELFKKVRTEAFAEEAIKCDEHCKQVRKESLNEAIEYIKAMDIGEYTLRGFKRQILARLSALKKQA